MGLQERIKDSLYASGKKPWYSRWWGMVLVIVGCLFIVWAFVFTAQVIKYYRAYSSGIVPGGTDIDQLRQDAKIDLLHNGDDPSIGPATAPITIVAFEDFECPFCLQAQPALKKLLATHAGDVRFIYKDFPLNSIHPKAQSAAEAAQCAFEQGKFWEFHDALFANQERYAEAYYRSLAKELGLVITAFNECMATGKYKKDISQDVELGRALGVVGTPTFFVNGELFVQGYSPEVDGMFEKAIEYLKAL